MYYVPTPTTSCSARLFATPTTCYIPCYRSHLLHHRVTICENARIHCSYLTITDISLIKISSLMLYKNAYQTHLSVATMMYVIILLTYLRRSVGC